MEEVQLLVFIDFCFAYRDRVERFAPKAENGLGLHVAALGDAAAGRKALGNEDGALETAGVVAVVMHVAVAQLAVVEAGFLGAFLSQFLNAGNFFTLLFVALDFLQEYLGGFGVDVQIVV